jgi:L,D-transpeptidase YcbB
MGCFRNIPVGNSLRTLFIAIGVFFGSAAVYPAARAEFPPPLPLAEAIQNRLQAERDTFFCQIELPRFYALRQYMPAWLTSRGLRQDIPELLETIQASAYDGLQPNDYHLTAIHEIMGLSDTLEENALPLNVAARLDLLLTDAFLLLGSHLTAGRVNPESIDPEWFATRRQGDMPKLLERALATGAIRDTLLKQLPHYAGYHRLKATYRRFLAMADQAPWPQVPGGRTLKVGIRDSRTAILRECLSLWSEKPLTAEGDPEVFDAELEKALMIFQKQHGLESDGQLGHRTLAALNVPLEDRIQQLAANLWNWQSLCCGIKADGTAAGSMPSWPRGRRPPLH